MQDKRTTEYRKRVGAENVIGNLQVFCGFLVIPALFFLAIFSLGWWDEPGDTSLFSGGILATLRRFIAVAFFVACLWGIFPAWADFREKKGREREDRKETLRRIEQDSDWWQKADEWQQRHKNEVEEAKSDRMRNDPDV